jgi:hypothetical protein
MKRLIAVAIVAATAIVAVVLLAGGSEPRAEAPQCEGETVAVVGYNYGGQSGRFGTADEAVQYRAKEVLKSYDKLEKRSEKEYQAKKGDKTKAIFTVRELPKGGFESPGGYACPEDMKEDKEGK